MPNVSILKRAPSTFRLRIEGPRVNGKRTFTYETIHGSKADAKQRAAELKASKPSAGAPSPAAGVTLKLYATQWLKERELLGIITPQSAAQYELTFRRHVFPALGAHALQEITTVMVRAHLAELAKELAPSTLRSAKVRLSMVMAAAMDDGLVAGNPCAGLKTGKISATAGRPMDDEQRNRVLALAQGSRMGPLVRFAIATGFRRGEIAALTWRNVDLAKGTVSVQQGAVTVRGKQLITKPKTEASQRTIGLPASVLDELRVARTEALEIATWRKKDVADMPVFTTAGGRQWTPGSLTNAVKAFMIKAGLPDYHLHDLRHAHASGLLKDRQNLKAVARRLGHSDARTTLSVYAHVLPQDDEALVASASNLLESTPDDDAI